MGSLSKMKIYWTPTANKERFEQLDYIAQDDPQAAISQDEKIEYCINLLPGQPNIGRTGRIKDTRELVISQTPFIAIYRVTSQRIEVLRFLRGSQKWPHK